MGWDGIQHNQGHAERVKRRVETEEDERLTLFDVAGPATDGGCILAQSHQCWDAVLHLDGNREDAYLRKNRGSQRDQESTCLRVWIEDGRNND